MGGHGGKKKLISGQAGRPVLLDLQFGGEAEGEELGGIERLGEGGGSDKRAGVGGADAVDERGGVLGDVAIEDEAVVADFDVLGEPGGFAEGRREGSIGREFEDGLGAAGEEIDDGDLGDARASGGAEAEADEEFVADLDAGEGLPARSRNSWMISMP